MKKSYFQIVVPRESEGLRLDMFLAPYMSSRSGADRIIKDQRVKKKKAGKYFVTLKPSCKVKAGECYRVSFPVKDTSPSKVLKPYEYKIPILYEDEQVLVINKPAGIVVHPGPGHEQDTLVNALVEKVNLSPGVTPLRPGVVHRLDKDVSGLMLLSKTKSTEEFLIEQFKRKKVKRLYRALALGKVKQKNSTIVSFIGRHPKNRKKFYSFKEEVVGAKKAVAHYRVLESFQNQIHHIECELETGRTHQIRVQLSEVGLPILGEELYSSRRLQNRVLKEFSFKKNTFSFQRLALYSAFLAFVHPVGGKMISFSLNWPKELCFLGEQLKFRCFFERT